MKKNIISKLILLVLTTTLLGGCGNKDEEPIVNKDESTIIKNATNADEYIKKEGYKSLSYAYIYNIKSGLKSYESMTTGSVKAKVLFFDYNIKYDNVIYKNGNIFYQKDNSTSTFINIQNEFYMADKEKILVSRDLKKYEVYTLDDYHQISYSPEQYTIMGYVFNDESIKEARLVSNSDESVKIKYTLDNELATNLVKLDLKCNGGLSEYPKFKNIEINLEMKKDFTPISYSINSIYDASKPVIGSSEVTQSAECKFSKINGSVTITNEDFLIQNLGLDSSKIKVDDEENEIKASLGEAIKNLDFKNGVNVNGYLGLNIFTDQTKLNIDTNLAFDVTRLSTDKIYNILSFYTKIEADEFFGNILSIAKNYIGNEYSSLLDDFHELEIVYDGEGKLYLIPSNNDGTSKIITRIKLTDIIDVLLKYINVYNIVLGLNSDLLSFKKVDVVDEKNYKVQISLNEDTINSIKTGLNTLFEDERFSAIKTILSYKDFGSINTSVEVANGLLKNIDLSLDYIKEDEEQNDLAVTLVKLHLEVSNKAFDKQDKIISAVELYEIYVSTLPLITKIDNLLANQYVNKAYLDDLKKAYEEYQNLSDIQKGFFNKNIVDAIEQIEEIIEFLDIYKKYDLDNLTNEDILGLAKAFHANYLNRSLLTSEIGEDNYSKLTNLSTLVDYSTLDSAISKMEGDDETAWELSEQEIKDIKLLFDISKYEPGVSTQIYFKLIIDGKALTAQELEKK